MEFPALDGFGHIDLTVVDVDRTVRWWEEVMGFKLINTRDTPDFKLRSVIHPSGFFIGFMAHTHPVSDKFDERGLSAWTTSPSESPTERLSKHGRDTSTNTASPTQAYRRSKPDLSWCFVIQTTSSLSSGPSTPTSYVPGSTPRPCRELRSTYSRAPG